MQPIAVTPAYDTGNIVRQQLVYIPARPSLGIGCVFRRFRTPSPEFSDAVSEAA